ncbi:MAG: hypothetical protein LBE79_02225 [Tannerella sp.]|nr:hypothetical protein [Tannerella sp.]
MFTVWRNLLTISKGFSFNSVFVDQQNTMPIDTLKNVVMDFIRKRYMPEKVDSKNGNQNKINV